MIKAMAALLAWAFLSAQAHGQEANDPYAPYAFLIGDWETGAAGDPPMAVQRFRWGPNHSYIWYSTEFPAEQGAAHVHFEGMIVWNGARGDLDFIAALEPGSLSLERGVVRAEADGAVVREIEAIGRDGAVQHFRQTYKARGADAAATSLMRRTPQGWAPNFPGADSLVMRRLSE